MMIQMFPLLQYPRPRFLSSAIVLMLMKMLFRGRWEACCGAWSAIFLEFLPMVEVSVVDAASFGASRV